MIETDTELVIEAVGLTKHRPGFTLGPIDLRVPRGLVTGFVGPNGSGKTTTLRSLLGLVRPDGGTLRMPQNSRIGVTFDQPFLLPDWRISDAAKTYQEFRPGWDQPHFENLCRSFGLTVRQRIKQLSRGEGSKLMIALAMGGHPELLVLDEPTSGLDPSARADLIDLLRDYMTAERSSILFSTHITSDLENFADHIVFIANGEIICVGTPEQLREEFAYAHGPVEDLSEASKRLVLGLRAGPMSFEGVVRVADSAAFGSGIQLEEPTLEQLVVHLGRTHRKEI